jgi:hypothetical protein
LYSDFARGAPDEVSADVVFLTADGQKMLGPVEDGERALRPLRQYGPPAVEQIGLSRRRALGGPPRG